MESGVHQLVIDSTSLRARRPCSLTVVRVCTAAVPCIEVEDVSDDSGTGHLGRIRHDFPRLDKHGPRRGQRVQEGGDEESVRVSGRVRAGSQDVLPELAHALHVRLDVRALGQLRGGEPAHGERLFELGVRAEVLLQRGPDLPRRRRLLEYPEPSIPDVDQKLQPRAGVAHLPTFERGSFRWGPFVAGDEMPQSARLEYDLDLERP